MKTYSLEMNGMVRQLLMSSLGTLRFVMFNESHPLANSIRQLELTNAKDVGLLYDKIKQSEEGDVLRMSLDEEILIYTSMDITCKAYMTDLGDALRKLNEPGIKKGEPGFTEIRSTILKGCEIVMDGMRRSFADEEDFEERVDVLEQFVLV
ncbi:MAG: hypothetical protein ACKPB3_03750 [Bacteroidota bacterium]